MLILKGLQTCLRQWERHLQLQTHSFLHGYSDPYGNQKANLHHWNWPIRFITRAIVLSCLLLHACDMCVLHFKRNSCHFSLSFHRQKASLWSVGLWMENLDLTLCIWRGSGTGLVYLLKQIQ